MSWHTRTRPAASTAHCLLLLSVVASLALGVCCQEGQWGGRQALHSQRRQRSAWAARRAADDSRPLTRVPTGQRAQSRSDGAPAEPAVITGRFKAPAPEQVHQQRVPKGAQFGAHTMSASYRVADADADPTSERLVHGIAGASGPATSVQRTVSAKFQVSDEGLNYPPSKLSADIYGNVAEIVTAPPEAVENDFLLPNSRRFGNARP